MRLSYSAWGIAAHAAEEVLVAARPISTRMVLQDGIGQNGTEGRHKTQLLAHGFRQRSGIVGYEPARLVGGAGSSRLGPNRKIFVLRGN